MKLIWFGAAGAVWPTLAEALQQRGHTIVEPTRRQDGLDLVRTHQVDGALIVDDADLEELRSLAPWSSVLVLGPEDRAVRATSVMARGAFGYVFVDPEAGPTPEALEAVVDLVDRAAARARVEADRQARLEESLRSRKFYEDVIESVGQGIVVVDTDARIKLMNPEAARILGEQEGEGGASAAAPLLQLLVETLTSQDQRSAMLAIDDGEQKSFLDVTSSVLRGIDGRATGAVGIVSDRSAEKRLEAQLVHTERLATLGSLLASIAHEINNTLTSVTGSADLGLELIEGIEESARGQAHTEIVEQAKEARESLELVLQAGLSGQAFANNLLQYSRQGGPSRRVMEDVNQLVRKTVDMLGRHLGLDKVRLEMDLAPNNPRARVESSKLQQAVVNLVVNAVQAMQDLPAERRVLRLVTRHDAEARRVECRVIDEGPGISQRQLERIFQPFFTTKESGTGLGLYITRKVIEDQEGEIEVESEPGVGTAFTIRLPGE